MHSGWIRCHCPSRSTCPRRPCSRTSAVRAAVGEGTRPAAVASVEESHLGGLEGRERELRELREATAKAEQALREAQIAANVTPIIRAEAEETAPSRLRRMGLVDELDAR